MEPVSAMTCEQWQHAIAVDALGGLEPGERAGLLAHLDGCASCREVDRELRETAGVLAFVDRDTVGETAHVPAALTERVLGTLHEDARAARRRHRVRLGAVVGGVGAIAASLALVLVLASPAPTGGSRTVVLSGSGRASATAVLTSQSWGTSISFAERGLPAGGAYEVDMRTSSGRWWSTGSFGPADGRAVGPVSMACYVPMRQVTGIRVTNAAGASVLESVAAPGTSW